MIFGVILGMCLGCFTAGAVAPMEPMEMTLSLGEVMVGEEENHVIWPVLFQHDNSDGEISFGGFLFWVVIATPNNPLSAMPMVNVCDVMLGSDMGGFDMTWEAYVMENQSIMCGVLLDSPRGVTVSPTAELCHIGIDIGDVDGEVRVDIIDAQVVFADEKGELCEVKPTLLQGGSLDLTTEKETQREMGEDTVPPPPEATSPHEDETKMPVSTQAFTAQYVGYQQGVSPKEGDNAKYALRFLFMTDSPHPSEGEGVVYCLSGGGVMYVSCEIKPWVYADGVTVSPPRQNQIWLTVTFEGLSAGVSYCFCVRDALGTREIWVSPT